MELPLLEVAGVHVSFPSQLDGRLDVLRGVDLSLLPGQTCGLLGVNGAGKTTLLRVLAGSLVAEKGTVALSGRDVTHMPQHRRAREMSYVDQDSYKALVGPLTVGEVLALAARRGYRLRPWGWRRDDTFSALGRLSSKAAGMLNLLGSRPTSELSGGQRQLVGIAAGVLGRPKVLLLDEYLASLDDEHSAEASRLIGTYVKEQQAAAIMVSHDIRWIEANVQMVVRLVDGRLEHLSRG